MTRLLFLLPVLAPAMALAQTLSPLSPDANAPMPACGPEMDGQVMCRFGQIYECEYIDPKTPVAHTGWRWHEDILRGCHSTPPPADMPANGAAPQFPGLTYAPQYNTQGTQPSPTQPNGLAPPRRLR